MVGQEILVRQGGATPVLKSVTEVWFRNSANLLARASSAYVVVRTNPADKNTGRFVAMFQGMAAPATLTATITATSATLKWGAVTGAVKYQILQRVNATQGDDPYTVRKEIVPASGTAWTGRTWKLATGFAKNNTYVLSVRAVDTFGQIGPETNPAIKYSPGMSLKVEHQEGDNDTMTVHPTACASYDGELKWARFPDQPCEGFVKGSTTQNRNRYGCIDYPNIYEMMVERYGKASNGVEIADHIKVTSAYLKDIVRYDDSHPTAATLHLHPGQFKIGNATKPEIVPAGESQDVAAPPPGKARGSHVNITDDSWGQKLVAKSRTTNGLMIYRSDGLGAVRMEGIVNFPDNWVLVLTYTWSVTIQAAQGAKQSPWKFPE